MIYEMYVHNKVSKNGEFFFIWTNAISYYLILPDRSNLF